MTHMLVASVDVMLVKSPQSGLRALKTPPVMLFKKGRET